jgi:nucleoside-diphosphate-sugar epimerase
MAERVNLVTGACGFTGMHLVKRLLDRGERVVATDLATSFASEKRRAIFRGIGLDLAHPSLEVVPADLTDDATLAPLFARPVTHLFHTASLYDYSASLEALTRINLGGFHNLVERAAKADLTRFIHWSTCGVFGKPYTPRDRGKCNVPFSEANSSPRNAPFGQDQPTGTHLVNEYSVTKWKQEQIAWKVHRERGLPLTVVRPAPIYGPGSDYGHGGIILTVHRGWVPVVPLDAKNYLTTSVHVDDIVGFADYISRRDDAVGEDFNVVDDSVISYYEFMKYIALLLGRRMLGVPGINLRLARPVMVRAAKLWLHLERRYGIPRVRVFEVQSATYVSSSYWISNRKSKDWGYAYRYPDVREGLRDTVQWFRDMGWFD